MNKNNQICDGYNPKVLMGNWYEQSYAVYQPVREAPQKAARIPQVEISFKDLFGNLTPLNRMARLQPWNTKGLLDIQNQACKQNVSGSKQNGDGCKQNVNIKKQQTIMKQSYDLGTINNFHKEWKSRPYNKENQPIPSGKTHAQLNKVNKQYSMFNNRNRNLGQLFNQAQSKQRNKMFFEDFKSQIKLNPHVNPKETMETNYQKNFIPNKLEELNIINKNFQTIIKSTYSANGNVNMNRSSKCFNKLNMKKLADNVNNLDTIGAKAGTSGFYHKCDKSGIGNSVNGDQNFRRIRSEITLNNAPLNMTTFK